MVLQLNSILVVKTKANWFQFQKGSDFIRNFVIYWTKSKLEKIKTKDGSITFYAPQYEQTYHSIHGAQTETERVFLELGMDYAHELFGDLDLLEMGWGTGLNSLLTLRKANREQIKVSYTTLEAYPIAPSIYESLEEDLVSLHQLDWENTHAVSDFFNFRKKPIRLQDFTSEQKYHLVYFDAFSPNAQPELWSIEVFEKMYDYLVPGGALVTYCSKNWVQKNMRAAGFIVEKHPGPLFKREVLRAIKQINE